MTRAKSLTATILRAIPTRDGGWSLQVRIEGSSITALVRSDVEVAEGRRVQVMGAGVDWVLAA
jgi:hypothetical protein